VADAVNLALVHLLCTDQTGIAFNCHLNMLLLQTIESEPMRKSLASIMIACALTLSAGAAEVSAKITGVHLCCKGCVTRAEKAVSTVKGATASVDADAETVSLAGPDTATVQKAADALVAAGFFGKSGTAGVKLAADSGAKGGKVQSLKLEGVHLCCGKCVSAVDKAVKSVSGVNAHTAKKNADSFEVTGDFNDQEIVDALHKAGLTGKVAK